MEEMEEVVVPTVSDNDEEEKEEVISPGSFGDDEEEEESVGVLKKVNDAFYELEVDPIHKMHLIELDTSEEMVAASRKEVKIAGVAVYGLVEDGSVIEDATEPSKEMNVNLFCLNYHDDDGDAIRTARGVVLEILPLGSAEERECVRRRMMLRMNDPDDTSIVDSVRAFCSAPEKSSDQVRDAFLVPFYNEVKNFCKERKKFYEFDHCIPMVGKYCGVEPLEDKLSDSLVSVKKQPGDNKNILVSFNYAGPDGTFHQGISVVVPGHGFEASKDRMDYLASELKERYLNGDLFSLHDKVTDVCNGTVANKIYSEWLGSAAPVDGFLDRLKDKQDSLERNLGAFVVMSQEDVLNRYDDKLMQRANGYRNRLVEVVKSDKDSVTFRFNYGQGEDGSSLGITYQMPWVGTNAVTLEEQARFTEILADRYANDKGLQEEVWRYKLSRFRNDFSGKAEAVQEMDDERSSSLAKMFHDLEREAKFYLPQLQEEKSRKDAKQLDGIREEYERASTDYRMIRQEFSDMGFFGKLKMCVFHYSEWQEMREEEAVRKEAYQMAEQKLAMFTDAERSPNSYIRDFRSLEPERVKEEKESILDIQKNLNEIQNDMNNDGPVSDKQKNDKKFNSDKEETVEILGVADKKRNLKGQSL